MQYDPYKKLQKARAYQGWLGEYDDEDADVNDIDDEDGDKEYVNVDGKRCNDNDGKNNVFENEKTIDDNDDDGNRTDDIMIGAIVTDLLIMI